MGISMCVFFNIDGYVKIIYAMDVCVHANKLLVCNISYIYIYYVYVQFLKPDSMSHIIRIYECTEVYALEINF